MPAKKILLVDDDHDLLLGLKIRLTKSGYDVVFATDGLTAITAVRKENPDLIILDIGLPAGDGFSVITRLKKLLNITPIIILSGSDPALTMQKAVEAGAVAFLQKPVDNDRLLITVEKALGE